MRKSDNIKEIVVSKNRDFKGIWVPKKLYLSGLFSPNEKFILIEIYSLSKNNKCYATNKHFANFVGLRENTVQKMMLEFERAGYIKRIFEYKEDSKEIKERIIVITQKFLDEFVNEKSNDEKEEPYGKKSIGGMEKNPEGDGFKVGDKYNNISDTYLSDPLYSPTELNSFSKEKETSPSGLNSSISKRNKKAEPDKWIATKTHIEICMERNGYSKEAFETAEAIEIVKTYYEKYREVIGQPHPRLNDKTMMYVIEQYLNGFGDGETSVQTYRDLIDFHFSTEYRENIDWTIQHFMSGDIRKTLLCHNML
jgi:CTP-dependent riboflavin kinase